MEKSKLFSLGPTGNLIIAGEEIIADNLPEATWEALRKLYPKSPRKREIIEAAKALFPGRFECTCCGECCRHISEILPDFDTGNGVCYHLEETGKCDIYEERPLICRVEDFWERCLRGKITKEDWYKTNYESCDSLRSLSHHPPKDPKNNT